VFFGGFLLLFLIVAIKIGLREALFRQFLPFRKIYQYLRNPVLHHELQSEKYLCPDYVNPYNKE